MRGMRMRMKGEFNDATSKAGVGKKERNRMRQVVGGEVRTV